MQTEEGNQVVVTYRLPDEDKKKHMVMPSVFCWTLPEAM
jgi:hypothetical protein